MSSVRRRNTHHPIGTTTAAASGASVKEQAVMWSTARAEMALYRTFDRSAPSFRRERVGPAEVGAHVDDNRRFQTICTGTWR